jgi:hypothetical protein
MSIYTQEAVFAEINYRLEVANAHRGPGIEGASKPARRPWWRKQRAASGTRQRVVRATPATQ